MNVSEAGLIGDIGATNARFALVQPDGNTTRARAYKTNDYPSLTDAIYAYLADESPPARPTQAVLRLLPRLPMTKSRSQITRGLSRSTLSVSSSSSGAFE